MEETHTYYVLSVLHILFHLSVRVTPIGRYYLVFYMGFIYLVNITDLVYCNKYSAKNTHISIAKLMSFIYLFSFYI